jgi:hypothetical protein
VYVKRVFSWYEQTWHCQDEARVVGERPLLNLTTHRFDDRLEWRSVKELFDTVVGQLFSLVRDDYH